MAKPHKGRATVPRKPRHGTSGGTDAPIERQDLAAVVALLRGRATFTRHELELETGLRRAAVTDRLTALVELGLAEEGEAGKSSGGRAPRLIRFCFDAGAVLVAVVGQSTLGMGVADLSGRLVFEHHEATDDDLSPDAVITRLITLFGWALEQLAFDPERVWSIALSLPGQLDILQEPPDSIQGGDLSSEVQSSVDTRYSYGFATWHGVPVAKRLMRHFRCSVHLRSRIQMMTLGEMRHGMGAIAGADPSNLLLIDVGKEVNAGVISAGCLHLGAQRSAGLLGHSPVVDANTRCRCGNSGCLETEVGSAALVAYAIKAAREGRSDELNAILDSTGSLTVADVLICAQNGDGASAELLARTGRLVGIAAATLVNVLNPSAIVLTGRIAQTGDAVLAAFRESLYRTCHPLVTRDLIIVRSVLGSSGSLAGAAIVATDALFELNALALWVGSGTPVRNPELQLQLAQLDQESQPRSIGPPLSASVSK